MKKTISINVTQKDINTGKAVDAYSCPIARAVNRRLTKNRYSSVTQVGINVVNRRSKKRFSGILSILRIEVPRVEDRRQVGNFLLKFDAGHKEELEPFTFRAELPARMLR